MKNFTTHSFLGTKLKEYTHDLPGSTWVIWPDKMYAEARYQCSISDDCQPEFFGTLTDCRNYVEDQYSKGRKNKLQYHAAKS